MVQAQKKIVISNNTTQKSFSYSKNKVSLKFTLRIDIKEELKNFLELLVVAQEDVKKTLKEI